MDNSRPHQRRRLSKSEYSLLRSFVLIQTNSMSRDASSRSSSTKDRSKPDQELAQRRRASVDAPPRLPGLGERTKLRRVLTSEAPLPDLPYASKPSREIVDVSKGQYACRSSSLKGGNGFRKDYMLGDPARSIRHMKIETTLNEVSKLKTYDFAFIKRFDESWTYAICASRFEENGEECMLFVLNKAGATKILKRKYWADSIRIVAAQNDEDKIPRDIYIKDDMSDDFSSSSYGSC